MRIKRILLIFLMLGCFFSPFTSGSTRADDFTESRDISLLPTTTLVQTSTKTYNPDNLFQYINGQAEQFFKYGFLSLKTFEYTDLPRKSIHATVELYHMTSPLAAFGIYSAGRFEGARYTGHGTEGFVSDPVLVFFKGDYYVKISCFSSNSERQDLALEQLAGVIDKNISGNEKYPSEIDFLTKVGINPRTISYGEKGLLGYDFLPSGFQMRLTLGEETFDLFAVICADAIQAQDALRSYVGAMRIENRTIQERFFESVKMWEVDDPYHGMVIILANKNIFAGIKNLPENPEAGLKILIKITINPDNPG